MNNLILTAAVAIFMNQIFYKFMFIKHTTNARSYNFDP